MLGYAGGLNNLGTVVAVLYSGIVSRFDWRLVFLIYLLALVCFVISAIFLPNGTHDKKIQTRSNVPANASRISCHLVMIWVKMLLLTVIYFIIPTNLSFYMSTQFSQHNPILVGILMSVLSLFGVVSGILYARLLAFRNSRVQETVVISIFAIGFCLLSFATTLPLFIIGLLLTGWGHGWGLPYLNAQLFAAIVEKSSHYVGIGQSMIFLGQFISLFLISFLSNLFHQKNSFVIGESLVFVFMIMMMLDLKTTH